MDIVERLRVRAKIESKAGVREIEDHIDWIAADEIERLREALKEIAKEQSAKTAEEAADKFQRIARAALKGDE